MEEAAPETRTYRSSALPAPLARRAAAFTFALEAVAIGRRGSRRLVSHSRRRAIVRGGSRIDPHLERTRNHHRRDAPSVLHETSSRVGGSASSGVHRSTHATNAGGNLVAHDQDAQDAFVVQERCTAGAGRVNRR